jgi:hypothetical protein
LHELPGSAHQIGPTSKSHGSDHPLRSRSDCKDHCLICQFIAQGQLSVEVYAGSSSQLIADLVLPIAPKPHFPADSVPSSRAPPLTGDIL